ncbi:MAG: 2-succinyl-5-enolpyruvyl-6-hydroxy-3-cyclohexene-1-carboxylic-acid synthase [Ignavibacteria bacterium]|nr:2-succinyl-5-enolpyruvyl-6-hydroxy-3-cyclohexene-1-carboxylic-acid synthase [Ignavibacteria bacterium]
MKKIKVNRNNFWTEVFVKQLSSAGIKYACISPGSRSTPLTFALAKNKKIKCFVNIDERSSAFFALGLAKASKTPVAVVTTSGTAAAELYPAIIEAYQQRVPLIICTADRPPELLNTGANQTINQHNLYKNHIRWFKNIGLPSLKRLKLRRLQQTTFRAVEISTIKDRGPVHLNFPFRKPLEPFTFTNEIDSLLLKEVDKSIKKVKPSKNKLDVVKLRRTKRFKEIVDLIIQEEEGLIIVGPMEYDINLRKQLKNLSSLSGYPIIADAASHLRFNTRNSDRNILSSYHTFLSSNSFSITHKPKIILQFGRTPTSSSLETYLENCDAPRYMINKFGDWFDLSKKSKAVIKYNPEEFIKELINILSELKPDRKNSVWLKDFITAEKLSESIKNKIIEKSTFPSEPGIINNLLEALPNKSHILIGNSTPIRDFDNYAACTKKKLLIYFNRGASGIDGITSTALGIAQLKEPSFLLTGDLSLLHDLNSLAAANKYPAGLTIILINNNGGGIFKSLPVSKDKSFLKKYFLTPHNLNLKKIIASFGVGYKLLRSWKDLSNSIDDSANKKFLNVLEIKTDVDKSLRLRTKYLDEVKIVIDNSFKV